VAETEIRDEFAVFLVVDPLHVLEEPPSPAYHLQEALAAVMVLLVLAEMTLEMIDAVGQNRDLDGRAAPVTVVNLILADDFFLYESHRGNASS
jgi:hypothetical protein